MHVRSLKNARLAAAIVFTATCGLLAITPRAAFGGVHSASAPAGDDKKAGDEKKYTCPMHPEISADKPGKCPKCGMNLVEKKKT